MQENPLKAGDEEHSEQLTAQQVHAATHAGHKARVTETHRSCSRLLHVQSWGGVVRGDAVFCCSPERNR
ncbi:hypothetical protein NQZ68_036135 [Dissostichus eleginoides]|nr:hypothetical protein NQZ68_036135 [Dissostichus eleginoides]